MIKVCEQCNKEFHTYNSKRRFCSQSCWGEYQWVEYPPRICANCGETFRREPSKMKSDKVYCSIKCANTAPDKRRKQKSKFVKVRMYNCEYCGKELAQIWTKGANKKKYCNISCSNKARWEKKNEKKNVHLWAGIY